MSDDQVTYLIVGAAGLISVVAWALLILVPAWTSYWRLRERLLAAVMSVYVLAALVGAGVGLRDAMPLANKAGGIVVGKFGTATVSYEELFT